MCNSGKWRLAWITEGGAHAGEPRYFAAWEAGTFTFRRTDYLRFITQENAETMRLIIRRDMPFLKLRVERCDNA